MKSSLLFILLLGAGAFSIQAQYNPKIFNYGISFHKPVQESAWGGGVRMEFAYNCYTTFTGELNYTQNNLEAYAEFAGGVNLILFNFHPTTITAGMGYVVNNDVNFELVEDEAFLVFNSGDLHHGAQLKLRVLQQFSAPFHLFAEVNLKSLGVNYHTLALGFNYNFGAARAY